MKIARSVGVHDGTFHADEVTACALLVVFNLVDRDKIVRTRDKHKLATCEFVCDVGGIYDPKQKLFDHHQSNYKGDLASAGMILRYLKEERVISVEENDFFNNSLILGVDAHDNGRASQEAGTATFSHVIANFAPIIYDATPEELSVAFHAALDFAIGHLKRLHQRFSYHVECRKIVGEAMQKYRQCLVFDRAIPWLESFFALKGENHTALYDRKRRL